MRNGLVGAELSGAARACAQAEPDHHLAELAGRAGALRQELFGQLQKSPSGVVDNHTGVCVCVVSAQPRRRSPAPAALLPAASPGSSDIPGVCVLLWAPRWRIYLWQLQRPDRRRKKYRILPVLIFRLCAVMYGSHIVNLLLLSARIT